MASVGLYFDYTARLGGFQGREPTMTNHPNRHMTPARLAFLEAALANGNRIIRPMHSLGWIAGECRVQERMGEACYRLGLIAPVKEGGKTSGNTVRAGMGYLYVVTEAGRAALGAR